MYSLKLSLIAIIGRAVLVFLSTLMGTGFIGSLRAQEALSLVFKKIGSHPTSVLTPYPAIHNITPYQGRLFFGYGNYDGYPTITMVSYDPSDRWFRSEFSIASDSVGMMRVIDGTLWVPHVDPIHYEDFKDVSWKRNGVWYEQSPYGFLHAYDIARGSTGDLYLAGSGMVKSSDQGRTWTPVSVLIGGRLYWCVELQGYIFCEYGAYEEATGVFRAFTSSEPDLPTYLTGATKITPTSGPPFIIGLSGKSPGLGSGSGNLVAIASFSLRSTTVAASTIDFVLEGSRLVVLSSSGNLSYTDNPLPQDNVFTPITVTGLPRIDSWSSLRYTALASQDGVYYVGDNEGNIYAGHPTQDIQPALGLRDEVPPAHGRGLEFHKNTLVIGSPDTGGVAEDGSTPVVQAGRVQLYGEVFPDAPQPATSQSWSPLPPLEIPPPAYSGWLGKNVALSNDWMAVIETGYDLSHADRGKDALVHLYYQSGTEWELHQSLYVPFCHSAAFSPDGRILAVATANPAANQEAGIPGVFCFSLSTSPVPQVKFEQELRPQSGSSATPWGYKPSTRVAFLGNDLVASFGGDPSRSGGDGMAVLWRRSTTNPVLFITSPAWSVSFATSGQFGYGLDADAGWIAVGAPRDDTGAANAGAVYLYPVATPFAVGNPLKLMCPQVQPDAAFGHSVALRGRTLIVGAPGLHEGARIMRGAVFIYRWNGQIWQPQGTMTPPESSIWGFGNSVTIGDVWMAAASRMSAPGTSPAASLAFAARPDPVTDFSKWVAQITPAVPPNVEDPDNDGFTLLEEYIWNLNPLIPDLLFTGTPRIQQGATAGAMTFSWLLTQRPDDPRLSLSAQESTVLRDWTDIPASDITEREGADQTRTASVSRPLEGERFFRIKVNYALPAR